MPWKDKKVNALKHREYVRLRYAIDKEFRRKQLARVRKNKIASRIKVRGLLAEIKSKGCSTCNEQDPRCLDFHHIVGKDFCLSQGVDYGIKRVMEELEKCICICANCHRKIHSAG
jgi:hypothetical protein